MFASRQTDVTDDLRFALDTLEQSSHLGLDAEYAAKIRAVILRQIERNKPQYRPLAARRIALVTERAGARTTR